MFSPAKGRPPIVFQGLVGGLGFLGSVVRILSAFGTSSSSFSKVTFCLANFVLPEYTVFQTVPLPDVLGR